MNRTIVTPGFQSAFTLFLRIAPEKRQKRSLNKGRCIVFRLDLNALLECIKAGGTIIFGRD